MDDNLPPMPDSLDQREFYELCQSYRHAQDITGTPNAAEAFELLKTWIRTYVAEAVRVERELWQTLLEHQCTIAPNYIRDGSGCFNGFIAVSNKGHHICNADTPREAALLLAASIRNTQGPKIGEERTITERSLKRKEAWDGEKWLAVSQTPIHSPTGED